MVRAQRIRVVTYNIHRCIGIDRRVRPERIVKILRIINADIIALQEVLSIKGRSRREDQARLIAEELRLDHCVGESRRLKGGIYGNVILSRLPIARAYNYNISVRGSEPRSCLRADVELRPNQLLHVFDVHLGTGFLERRHQARMLLDPEILTGTELSGARLLLGDFNEWTRGLASRLLATHLQSADIRAHLGRSRTYPGLLPLLHLDHIYFDGALELERLTLHRSRLALIASDHLPLVAEFHLGAREAAIHKSSR